MKKSSSMPLNPPLDRRLVMGLVGGAGGFIGRVHAMAAVMDGQAQLAAGALSSDRVKARDAAADFAIRPERAYGSYQEMLAAESRLPPGQRIDFVSITTPNDTHFTIAKAFVEAGFNVICEKPLTVDLDQASRLAELVGRIGVVFAVMHNYTGYPLVRQARDMVRGGELGNIHAVRAGYLQGSLYRQRTPDQLKRFAWKTDPQRTGVSGCFGDIGIHAFNLVRFITGLKPDQVSCHLRTYYPAGRLDDYGTAVLQFTNGSMGTITASRVSHGQENNLWISTATEAPWNGGKRSRTGCGFAFMVSRTGCSRATRPPDSPVIYYAPLADYRQAGPKGSCKPSPTSMQPPSTI
jgi:predicted dehydrogenase